MADTYYHKTKKKLFDPKSSEPFKLSRSKLELFLRCPRCFYLDQRLGIKQPAGFPFNLNSAVDHLLKKEFDIHRAKKEPHPLMTRYKINAVPYSHSDLDQWRRNFTGIQYLHQPTNFLVFGAIDDVWVNPSDELIIVDYKATAKDSEVNIDADWQKAYKNQMEVYQWLFRKNGFRVSNIGYFVYLNGRRDARAFDGKLEFDVMIIPYQGSDDWIEKTLLSVKQCLVSDNLPSAASDCEYCTYRKLSQAVESTLY